MIMISIQVSELEREDIQGHVTQNIVLPKAIWFPVRIEFSLCVVWTRALGRILAKRFGSATDSKIRSASLAISKTG